MLTVHGVPDPLVPGPVVLISGRVAGYLSSALGTTRLRSVAQRLPRPARAELLAALDGIDRLAAIPERSPLDVQERRNETQPDSEVSSSPCSVAEAAILTGRSRRRVQQLAEMGLLGGRKVGGRWQLDRAAVAAWCSEERETG